MANNFFLSQEQEWNIINSFKYYRVKIIFEEAIQTASNIDDSEKEIGNQGRAIGMIVQGRGYRPYWYKEIKGNNEMHGGINGEWDRRARQRRKYGENK